jgi:hypothetical protein
MTTAVWSDTLPADRFVKAGKVACVRQVENPRHTMCHATQYTQQPEFRDRKSPLFVAQYCGDCTTAYAKENDGRLPVSAADTL